MNKGLLVDTRCFAGKSLAPLDTAEHFQRRLFDKPLFLNAFEMAEMNVWKMARTVLRCAGITESPLMATER